MTFGRQLQNKTMRQLEIGAIRQLFQRLRASKFSFSKNNWFFDLLATYANGCAMFHPTPSDEYLLITVGVTLHNDSVFRPLRYEIFWPMGKLFLDG